MKRNAIHALLSLYQRRGHTVAVNYAANKKYLFDCAGIPYCNQGITHPWNYFPNWNQPSIDLPNRCWNKCGQNINEYPLPILDEDCDSLFDEMCDIIPFTFVPRAEIIAEVKREVPDKPILLHGRGLTNTDHKNLPEGTIAELLKIKGMLPIFMDGGWRGDLEHFGALLSLADCLVACDSGPIHFARFSTVRVVGVFHRHHPSACCLPNPHMKALCRRADCNGVLRERWGLVEYAGEYPSVAEIMREVDR